MGEAQPNASGIRRMSISAVLLTILFLAFLVIQVPSCSGGQQIIAVQLPTPQGQGEVVATSGDYILRRHTQYIEFGDVGTYSMLVEDVGSSTQVTVWWPWKRFVCDIGRRWNCDR